MVDLRGGQNPGAAVPSAQLPLPVSQPSRGLGRRTNPYPFHQILTEDAAVVPPETLGDGPDVLVWVGGGPACWDQKASMFLI